MWLKRSILLNLISLFILLTFELAAPHERTISIPAGTTRTVPFHLNWGDTVKGEISVAGGILHPGVEVKVTDPFGSTILNLGTVTGDASIEFTGGFIRGTYEVDLINPSWVSAKTVTLSYNIATNPLMHYNYEIIAISVVVALAAISVMMYKKMKRKKTEQRPEIPKPPEMPNIACIVVQRLRS